jgi:hypothetical protein
VPLSNRGLHWATVALSKKTLEPSDPSSLVQQALEAEGDANANRTVHGGPLWEALCYAQVGGLTFATAVTLFVVPVLYAIFVLDLKVVRWEPAHVLTEENKN